MRPWIAGTIIRIGEAVAFGEGRRAQPVESVVQMLRDAVEPREILDVEQDLAAWGIVEHGQQRPLAPFLAAQDVCRLPADGITRRSSAYRLDPET
jgi:hypothetical protein